MNRVVFCLALVVIPTIVATGRPSSPDPPAPFMDDEMMLAMFDRMALSAERKARIRAKMAEDYYAPPRVIYERCGGEKGLLGLKLKSFYQVHLNIRLEDGARNWSEGLD